MSALAEQYRIVADDLHVACFDAGSVIQLSMPDGIHLSRESHAKLGVAIAQWVKDIF
jgi:lysophospholipase L1-like esterase